MKGIIFNVQRFCTSDGPGIRTTVFLKGCPLSCAWCHNPESQSGKMQLMYCEDKCIGCGSCKVCKKGLHDFSKGRHDFIREECVACFECAGKCPAQALEICGEEKSPDGVVKECLKDEAFYAESGGGVTLSGGEPLAQYDFSTEILKMLKEKGIHTAVETSGYISKSLDEISKNVDLWLFDVKLINEQEHIRWTGVSNKRILDNLRYLDDKGANIILRCPIIPNVNLNASHFDEIVGLANSLKNVLKIQFEPYHPLGVDKAHRAGMIQKYDYDGFLNKEEIESYIEKIKTKTNVCMEIL